MHQYISIVALLLSLALLAHPDADQMLRRMRLGSGGVQIVTNPIAAARLPTTTTTLPNSVWSDAGATIVTRTTVCVTASCNTMTAAGASATAAQINAAIASATANTVVKLTTGTYTLSIGLTFAGANNSVTLRGDGPANTLLNFSDNDACGGIRATVCVKPSSGNFTPSGEQNNALWTSGYTKGTTTITIGANTLGSTKPFVGGTLILDQLDDSDTDQYPAAWVCVTGGAGGTDICSDEGGGGNAGRAGRGQHQLVTVTSVTDSGGGSCTAAEECTVGITPGLYHPNWRSGQTPGAWWANSAYISGIGVEDLKLDASGVTCASPDSLRGVITFYNATQSWAKNVETDTGCRAQIMLFQAHHITLRDSYIHESHAYSSQCYGVEWYVSDDNLIENNIVHYIVGSLELNAGVGNVIAYNYAYDNHNTSAPTYMQAGNQQHTTGNNFNLIEGNHTSGLKADQIHGTSNWETWFRNRAVGWFTSQTASTYPVQVYKYNRFFNAVGNVLGENDYHTTYAGGSNLAIYDLDVNGCSSGCTATGHVADTMFRWGNYDTVNDANTFDAAEVPSELTSYANPVPASQTIPSSLYLSAKPGFFKSLTWPPIGPDVTGGDLAGLNGHAYSIPAKLCYDTSAKLGGFLTAFDGSSGGACY